MNKKIIVILIVAIILLNGCALKESSNVLNVLNWSSYISDSVIRDFEEETGIIVNYGTYSSNEECLAKVQSAKEGTYDLIFPSDYMIELMIKRDLIQKMDLSQLTNLENINPNYLGLSYDRKNEYSVPFIAASVVVAVNRDLISDEITTYQDLLSKDYRNNIVMLDDQRIVIGMALLALGYDMNETDPVKLEEAKDWLLELKPNIKAYDSDSPKTFLISKETALGVIWNAEAALAVQENPNIEVIIPEEGFAVSIDNFAIPKNAKHVENAYRFIDYILRDDVMVKIIEDYPYKNVNKKAEASLPESYLKNHAANINDAVFHRGTFVENIGEDIVHYDKLWAEIK